ncbi:unnamed protein product [Linum trigynum]|uniref:DUF4283 domain-containing protein n=1 Tax=Linum trigynum TaxID=586398 RepID=A0AAV2CBV9_9ROSI
MEIDNSAIPAWIKLSGLTTELASREGLGRIASSLGRPLCMDHSTARRENFGTVRICVEIQAKKPRVNRISIISDNMKEMFINVEYCGLPSCCAHCGGFLGMTALFLHLGLTPRRSGGRRLR